jgi:PAS domain S-box-containing protein
VDDLRLEKVLSDKKNLERILDNLKEGIIAHDTRRRIVFFNRSAEELTGYRRDQILGEDCHKVFGQPFCGDRCSFCSSPPHSWKDMEYPVSILTRGGGIRRVEMTVTGMNDDAGKFVGIIAAFRDVTDLVGLKILTGNLKGFGGIIGRTPKMLQIYSQIQDVAASDYPVYITGETGTGKELVAEAIHNKSRRSGGPFVPINCAALPEGMLESELFGHVKGAFTGALRDKKGRFELAHNGTLLLDEVADLPQTVQAKLLRVLQDGTFERVGGEKRVSVDVRLVSATNKDLKNQVRKGRFRDDLYYRINVVPLHLPPIRERKKDIPLLVEHFLETALKEGQKTEGISKEGLAIIMEYPWPGNVRELQSAIHFALVKCRGRIIRPTHLPRELRAWKNERASRGPSKKLNLAQVQTALKKTAGNKAKAARDLGVGRATLYRFLNDSLLVS